MPLVWKVTLPPTNTWSHARKRMGLIIGIHSFADNRSNSSSYKAPAAPWAGKGRGVIGDSSRNGDWPTVGGRKVKTC